MRQHQVKVIIWYYTGLRQEASAVYVQCSPPQKAYHVTTRMRLTTTLGHKEWWNRISIRGNRKSFVPKAKQQKAQGVQLRSSIISTQRLARRGTRGRQAPHSLYTKSSDQNAGCSVSHGTVLEHHFRWHAWFHVSYFQTGMELYSMCHTSIGVGVGVGIGAVPYSTYADSLRICFILA